MSDEQPTNTGKKQAGINTRFVKGDPRINRKGRPRSFDMLRNLAQQIANTPAFDTNGKPLRVVSGKGKGGEAKTKEATQVEALLAKLMHDDPVKFLEYAFGKVPDELELSGRGGSALQVEYVNDWRGDSATDAARGATLRDAEREAIQPAQGGAALAEDNDVHEPVL